jgi:hypothetical protein
LSSMSKSRSKPTVERNKGEIVSPHDHILFEQRGYERCCRRARRAVWPRRSTRYLSCFKRFGKFFCRPSRSSPAFIARPPPSAATWCGRERTTAHRSALVRGAMPGGHSAIRPRITRKRFRRSGAMKAAVHPHPASGRTRPVTAARRRRAGVAPLAGAAPRAGAAQLGFPRDGGGPRRRAVICSTAGCTGTASRRHKASRKPSRWRATPLRPTARARKELYEAPTTPLELSPPLP